MDERIKKDVEDVLREYIAEGIQGASERYCEIAESRDLKRWEQTVFREACRKAMREHDATKQESSP